MFFQSLIAQGPVIISGLDTEFGHRPGNSSHGTIGMWASVIQTGILDCVTNASGPTGGILVLGGGKTLTPLPGDMITDFWKQVGIALSRPVTFSNGLNITSVIFDPTIYSMIVVASVHNFGVTGGLTFTTGSTPYEHDRVCGRSNDIATFINNGGGFFGSTSHASLSGMGAYCYFNIGSPALISLPTSLGSNSSPTPTGTSMGIATIAGPYHNTFSSWPSFLTPLSNLNTPLPPRVCMLGGCKVIVPIDSTKSCCPELKNLVTNGNFNAGNTGFSSNYQFSHPILIPKKYDVVNSAGALSSCTGWTLADHTSCSGSGNFMVVNGNTNQSTNTGNIIWQQTITFPFKKDSTYKFCAFFKHLPQCCFDVIPKVRLEVTGAFGTIFGSTTYNSIITSSLPCNWQNINMTFVPTLSSPNVTLRIWLNHINSGDGNDLAIDDISLSKLPSLPAIGMFVSMQPNFQVTASVNTSSTSDDNLPSGCKPVWTVAEVTSINFSTNPPTVTGTTNQMSLPTWGPTTTFPGYTFGPHLYVITLEVKDCDCYAKTKVSKVIGSVLRTMSAKAPSRNITEGMKVQLSSKIKKS